MKLNRLDADAMIFQGTRTHAPTKDAKITPLRILKYFGNSVVTSFAKLIEFAEMLQQSWASSQTTEQTNAAKRPAGVSPQLETIVRGFLLQLVRGDPLTSGKQTILLFRQACN